MTPARTPSLPIRQSNRLTILHICMAIGFGMSGISSAAGFGPEWPNRVTYAIIAFATAACIIFFVAHPTIRSQTLMVAMVVAAAALRALGWMFTTSTEFPNRTGGAGASVTVASLMLIVHDAERRAGREH